MKFLKAEADADAEAYAANVKEINERLRQR